MEEKKKVKSISSTKSKGKVKEDMSSDKQTNKSYESSISDLEIIKAYENRGRNRLKVLAAFLLGIIAAIALFSWLGLSNKNVVANTNAVAKNPGYVGVYLINLEDTDAIDHYGLDDVETTLKKGVMVESVIPGSVAVGKLKKGDIIIEFDNEDIENVDDFMKELSKNPAGKKVVFAVERDGRIRDIKITLGSKEK